MAERNPAGNARTVRYVVCSGALPDGRPCRRVLGELAGDTYIQRYGGRATEGPLPYRIVCERCGAEWAPGGTN